MTLSTSVTSLAVYLPCTRSIIIVYTHTHALKTKGLNDVVKRIFIGDPAFVFAASRVTWQCEARDPGPPLSHSVPSRATMGRTQNELSLKEQKKGKGKGRRLVVKARGQRANHQPGRASVAEGPVPSPRRHASARPP